MSAAINYSGKLFGNFTVLGMSVSTSAVKGSRWVCLCVCGEKHIIPRSSIANNKLKSCSCGLNKGKNGSTTHNMSRTITFASWSKMNSRINNPRHKHYKHYGGKGIKICDRWKSFENFFHDMGERESIHLSLDRINTMGDYCKENCRWADKWQQNSNRTNNTWYEYKGRKMILAHWVKLFKTSRGCLSYKIRQSGYIMAFDYFTNQLKI